MKRINAQVNKGYDAYTEGYIELWNSGGFDPERDLYQHLDEQVHAFREHKALIPFRIRVMPRYAEAGRRVDDIFPTTIYMDDELRYWVSYKGKRYQIKSVPVNSCNMKTQLAAIFLNDE